MTWARSGRQSQGAAGPGVRTQQDGGTAGGGGWGGGGGGGVRNTGRILFGWLRRQ